MGIWRESQSLTKKQGRAVWPGLTEDYLFSFSFFNLRFSLMVSFGFFFGSLGALSFLPGLMAILLS